jgi:ATPase family associated with various cellular activities (AAA)
MTLHERWLTANNAYLSAALVWLRQLLAQRSAPASRRKKPPPPFQFIRPDLDEFDPLADVGKPKARRGVRAGQAAAAPDSLPPPALAALASALQLTEFETRVLFLSSATEFDSGIAALFAQAMGEPAKAHASFGLAFSLFDEPAWDAMSPERPLRYWRLIEISQPGAQPLTGSAIKADERIINFIKGLNYLDDRLSPLLDAMDGGGPELPPSHASIADDMESRLKAGGALPVCQLAGIDAPSKRAIALAVAGRLRLNLYRIGADSLPQAGADLETFLRLWQRETALMPVALYVEFGAAERDAPVAKAVARLLSRCHGIIFLDTRDAWPEPGFETAVFDIAKPLAAEQLAAWQAALGKAAPAGLPARLSGQFSLSLADIHNLAAAAKGQPAATLETRLWRGCLGRLRPALDRLGQTIDAKAGWDDLVLPRQEHDLLRQIAAQVRGRSEVYDEWGFRARMNRGLGISVLFAGDSGTGKTMAAEVIARDLGLILYRIDLSGVVSKYIGETEKNLRKVFDAAEDGGAVLFFDEADALFGARSEVKDSHDRYANIEINYLLQRIESYRGLAILASNMKKSLDQAFLRRLRFIVNFPHPGAAERLIMWEKAFPPQTPMQDLDAVRLAKLNLTGGSISNVALNAAFLAAQQGGKVTMALIFEAARAEFRKLEKPVNEADFRLLEAVGGKT